MIRDLIIQPVLNGYVVTIGCQKVVFTDPRILGDEVTRYYKDPETVEKEYILKSVNKMMDQTASPPCAIPEPNRIQATRPLAEVGSFY